MRRERAPRGVVRSSSHDERHLAHQVRVRGLEPLVALSDAASRMTQRSQRMPLTWIVSVRSPRPQSTVRVDERPRTARPSARPTSSCALAPRSARPRRQLRSSERAQLARAPRPAELARAAGSDRGSRAARSAPPPSGSAGRGRARPGRRLARRRRARGASACSSATNAPVSSTAVGWSGIRTSSVPKRGCGRTSHQSACSRRRRRLASRSTYASQPCVRAERRRRAAARQLGEHLGAVRAPARSSSPGEYGEFAESASTTRQPRQRRPRARGSRRRRRGIADVDVQAADALPPRRRPARTPTNSQVPLARDDRRAARAHVGCEPAAAIASPCSAAASATAAAARRSSASSASAAVAQTRSSARRPTRSSSVLSRPGSSRPSTPREQPTARRLERLRVEEHELLLDAERRAAAPRRSGLDHLPRTPWTGRPAASQA